MNAVSISQNIFLYKFNTFSILTKCLSNTVAITFAVWDTTAKLVQFFPFFPDSQHFTKSSFLPQILAASAYDFFLSLLSRELSSFHPKEALYGFSLASLNCQHHYSCTLGPLLNKIRVYWIQDCATRQLIW